MSLRSSAAEGRGAVVGSTDLPLQSFPLEREAHDIHRRAMWHKGWDVAALRMHHPDL